MPEKAIDAKPGRSWASGPWAPVRFAALVMAGFLAACLPILVRHGFDPAVFVVAGDRWVDAAETSPPLDVHPRTAGYDGQFYYRLAQNPFSVTPRLGGISFDHPAKRIGRIGYPLLAWAASFGRPAAAAWALFGVNLVGLGAIAWLASLLARDMALPRFVPVAIVLWPGFIVTLTRDTAEIVAAASMLAALLAFTRRRPASYAALAATALLTRETTLPLFCGLLLETLSTGRRRAGQGWPYACTFPLLALAAWRGAVWLGVHDLPQPGRPTSDVGWPFVGAAQALVGAVTGLRHWSRLPAATRVVRVAILLSAPVLLAFCCRVALRARRASSAGRSPGIVIGWFGTAALMSLLTAAGPWVDPVATLRAFTECYVVGCIVLGMAQVQVATWQVGAMAGGQLALAWVVSLALLP